MTHKKNSEMQELPESYRKTLHYFFSFPQKSVTLNELSKSIRISKSAAKNSVSRLVKEGVLKKEVLGKTWRIFADSKNTYTAIRKISYNLELIYDSEIVNEVYKKVPEARAIILFGSYRWGTDNEKSDIDIGVEILGTKDMRIETLAILNNLSFRKEVKVNITIFSRSKINLNLFTNIANGIVLDGLLEVHV